MTPQRLRESSRTIATVSKWTLRCLTPPKLWIRAGASFGDLHGGSSAEVDAVSRFQRVCACFRRRLPLRPNPRQPVQSRIGHVQDLQAREFHALITESGSGPSGSFLSRIRWTRFELTGSGHAQVGRQNAAECQPLIMEPQSAFYKGPLLVMDFQSLYPSVMIAYNYCYSYVPQPLLEPSRVPNHADQAPTELVSAVSTPSRGRTSSASAKSTFLRAIYTCSAITLPVRATFTRLTQRELMKSSLCA